ncbi:MULTISPECIES: ATP-binding protein [unclassified Candidatus Paralachnospira]|uniref:ATP-binding protein n=1 Tax=unclassified Candidatus Paralachnospira TaxID=3099471 RepID=UPI003F90B903
MEIIRGRIPCAKKIVIYGPEGIGKSTFASRFPDPVFIDTEGSTNAMDVARFPKATSWQMLLEQVDYTRRTPGVCKTLVIDTIDWAESMCIDHICSKHRKSGIEDFGYGNGYVYVKEELGRFLNKLSEVVEAGINVVLTAHAQIRKFEQPDELGAYDRWELKLGKKTQSQTSPLIKEWADMLLFANYKTFSVAVDDKGQKRKAQGGERVMYTTHHACWDAKNRYGLPDEAPFDYSVIASIIEQDRTERPATVSEPAPQRSVVAAPQTPTEPPAEAPAPAQPTPPPAAEPKAPDPTPDGQQMNLPLNTPEVASNIDPGIPKSLRDLMQAYGVDEWDIQNVVEAKGYVPQGTPVRDYDTVNPGIVEGLLVASWDQVYAAIKQMKEQESIPFN